MPDKGPSRKPKTAQEQRELESVNSAQDLYLKSMRGQELSPADALSFGLIESLLGATTPTSPYGSRESDWVDEEGSDYGLTYAERNDMYKQTDRLLRADPMMLNAHKQFMTHICGNGPSLSLMKSEDGSPHPLTKRLQLLIPDFPSLARFIISYTLKFGELFAIHFPIEGSELGRPAGELFTPNKCRKIHTKTPTALRSRILYYNFPMLRSTVATNGKKGYVPADAVTMFKVHEDLNDGLHGLSVYYVAMREIPRYVDWLHSRGLRARANSVFLILRSLKGMKSGDKHELPDQPMIIDTNAAMEHWDKIEATGSARDASSDGHEFRMRAAQGTGLAEPDISMDAQYGAQIKQGYATKLYEYYQNVLTQPLRSFVGKTIGLDPGRWNEIIVGWDFVDPRERTALVTEGSTLARDRVISRAAVHRRLGYDHELIERELKAELTQEAAPMEPSPMLPFGPTSLGSTPLVAPTQAPTLPVPPVIEAEQAIEKALPSGMLSSAGVVDTGMLPEDVSEAAQMPSPVKLGIDYGYAKNGAIVIGGPTPTGFSIVGEIWLHRAPLTGEASWEETLKELKETFPELVDVFVGSDAPEIVDLLKSLGFNVETFKQPIPEAVEKIKAYRANGGKFAIHPRCKRLVSELFPNTQDEAAGSHVAASNDFFDALRYLFTGVNAA